MPGVWFLSSVIIVRLTWIGNYIQRHQLLVRLTDSQFADDLVLFAMLCDGAEQSLV